MRSKKVLGGSIFRRSIRREYPSSCGNRWFHQVEAYQAPLCQSDEVVSMNPETSSRAGSANRQYRRINQWFLYIGAFLVVLNLVYIVFGGILSTISARGWALRTGGIAWGISLIFLYYCLNPSLSRSRKLLAYIGLSASFILLVLSMYFLFEYEE
jgi:energy-converting hydrogenase Eha subunit E